MAEHIWTDLNRATLESLALEAYRNRTLTAAQLRWLLGLETRIEMQGGDFRPAGQHRHGQAIGMEEWGYTQRDFVGIKPVGYPAACLQRVCQQIAMRQHGTLGKSRRSTGILENGEVIAGRWHGQIEDLYAALRVRCQHAAHHEQHLIFLQFFLGQAWFWMPGFALRKGIEPA